MSNLSKPFCVMRSYEGFHPSRLFHVVLLFVAAALFLSCRGGGDRSVEVGHFNTSTSEVSL